MPNVFGGIFTKENLTQTENNAAYDLTDASQNAGDGGIQVDGGSSLTINATDGGASAAASNAAAAVAIESVFDSAIVAGQALGTAVNAQTLANNIGLAAIQSVNDAAAINAALAGQTSDNALAGLQTLTRASQAATDSAISAALSANNRASAAAEAAASESSAASRAAASAAAAAASDAINAVNRSQSAALGFGTDALAAVRTAQASAFGFAGDSLAAVNTAQGRAFGFADDSIAAVRAAQATAFGFAGDALAASVAGANLAADASRDALESSLSFAKSNSTGALDFADSVFGDVLGIVAQTAERTQSEAAATRDFASAFVGDFYESQKAGDVQTIQTATKYAAIVGVVIALAWAIRGIRAA